MRVFVAAEFSLPVRDAIANGIRHFPVDDPPWRWVAAENWHLTLKFIGDATDPAAIGAALEPVAESHAAFDLSLGPFGGFPNLRRPRVFFYDVVDGAEALAALAGDIDAALAATLELPREDRRFRAHATVARIKHPLPAQITDRLVSVPPLENARQRVEAFTLLRSRLGPSGARYEPLLQFTLAWAK
jgi:2'-5' RNA ligase